jgi:hypothetical protein
MRKKMNYLMHDMMKSDPLYYSFLAAVRTIIVIYRMTTMYTSVSR